LTETELRQVVGIVGRGHVWAKDTKMLLRTSGLRSDRHLSEVLKPTAWAEAFVKTFKRGKSEPSTGRETVISPLPKWFEH